MKTSRRGVFTVITLKYSSFLATKPSAKGLKERDKRM